jgi:hypothetical protein
VGFRIQVTAAHTDEQVEELLHGLTGLANDGALRPAAPANVVEPAAPANVVEPAVPEPRRPAADLPSVDRPSVD